MKILGIETSCDETAAAVVENGTIILSNIVASSVKLHAATGGIIPETAARQQVVTIIPVIERALTKLSDIDAISVTVGPGLIGSLLVGIETAKALASLWNKPLVPVNHLVGHIYANFIREDSISKIQISKNVPEFPALGLVVSGGHTDLVLMNGHAAPATLARSAGGRGNIKWIGGTRDDAAGEAFDKTARLLGLPYPGGPAISAAAEKFLTRNPNHKLNMFPRPMTDEDNFDWSFSGLKTAVLRQTEKLKNPTTLKLRGASKKTEELSSQQISRLAAEIQEAIADVLVEKTLKAAELYKPKSLLIAGGVAANKRLREKFEHEITKRKMKMPFHVPTNSLCTDNASYIASCAFFNFSPAPWKSVSANPQLTIAGEN